MRLATLFVALVCLGASAVYLLPRAERALALRLADDDAAALADLQLAESFDRGSAIAEIDAALAADDVELAESFVALAAVRGIELPGDLRGRVARARSAEAEIGRTVSRFARGFVTGESDGIAGMSGAATGDLLFYGDVRDLTREGGRWLRGEKADPLLAGLATAGVAVTAGTYLSDGAMAPMRAGMSLFKLARRSGRIGFNLAADIGRLARSGRAGQLAAGLADVGRIEGRAGARTALEGLRHADDVADLGRVSRLAEKNGRSTLAILKTLGRGALVLGAGALTVALWVFGAAGNLLLLMVILGAMAATLVRWLWPVGRYAGAQVAAIGR